MKLYVRSNAKTFLDEKGEGMWQACGGKGGSCRVLMLKLESKKPHK
jgi:hypothetical protein